MILSSGYSPMSFFTKDYKKYFYMAELLALIDLSLVSIYCFGHTYERLHTMFVSVTFVPTVSRLSRWECNIACGVAVS